MNTKHTPTPWRLAGKAIDAKGFRIRGIDMDEADRSLALVDREENAAYIVLAVNAYEKDQEIIAELLFALKESHQDEILHGHYGDDPKTCSYCRIIVKAEGK